MNTGMRSHEALGLNIVFESPHQPLSHPGRIVRLLYPAIGMPFSNMNKVQHQLTLRYWITLKLIRHDLPGPDPMTADQGLENSPSSSFISP
jgi:hypothetical protein